MYSLFILPSTTALLFRLFSQRRKCAQSVTCEIGLRCSALQAIESCLQPGYLGELGRSAAKPGKCLRDVLLGVAVGDIGKHYLFSLGI